MRTSQYRLRCERASHKSTCDDVLSMDMNPAPMQDCIEVNGNIANELLFLAGGQTGKLDVVCL